MLLYHRGYIRIMVIRRRRIIIIFNEIYFTLTLKLNLFYYHVLYKKEGRKLYYSILKRNSNARQRYAGFTLLSFRHGAIFFLTTYVKAHTFFSRYQQRKLITRKTCFVGSSTTTWKPFDVQLNTLGCSQISTISLIVSII